MTKKGEKHSGDDEREDQQPLLEIESDEQEEEENKDENNAITGTEPTMGQESALSKELERQFTNACLERTIPL